MTNMTTVAINIDKFNSISDEQKFLIYKEYCKEFNACAELDDIFKIILKHHDISPMYKLSKDKCTFNDYIKRWVETYTKACKKIPSKHEAKEKKACSDPAIKIIIQNAMSYCDNEVCKLECYHNLFMSAENIQGKLLEEYIANNIKPFGWIWCKGTTLKSIDFCQSDGSAFLQIKNKYNTENSSSKKIRNGLSVKVDGWYRLDKNEGYCWDKLNEIINSHNSTESICNMTEEAYITFVSKVAAENKQIVCDK